MKKAIWKFPLKATDRQIVNMPVGSRILSVQAQRDIPCIWALVDPQETKVQQRRISVYGTGHDILHEPGTFLGTVQINEGVFAFHVFEDPS